MHLGPDSRPQPDLYVAHGPEETYVTRLPNASEVLLIVEVADSSIDGDREVKRPLYAAAGVPEYWIVNVEAACLERYSQPSADGAYGVTEVLAQADTLRHPLLGAVPVAALLAEETPPATPEPPT